jgi:tRNA-binding EMAP/Myf-like protein
VVVALAGDSVLDDEGEEMLVKKAAVGGVVSEGMLCDSRMLGWVGGAIGLAAQIPDSIKLGDAPPLAKPRTNVVSFQEEDAPPQLPPVQGLYEKKLTKEEKKKLAEEKRKSKKAVKDASK